MILVEAAYSATGGIIFPIIKITDNRKQNKVPNRLIHENSLYLLQHAYNPVDWFPWYDEAFAKAKAENKPIFLSIGYS